MAVATSYIGSLIAVSANVPATVDAAGFAALSYTTIGKIATWGATGDTTNDISVELLEGRVEHLNGSRDGGNVTFTYRNDIGDGGQTILMTQNNSNTNVSIRITEPDGKIEYSYGLIANLQSQERSPSAYKGFSGVYRVNSARVIV